MCVLTGWSEFNSFRETINISEQGRSLEIALAESLWARYCVHIALQEKKKGDPIQLSKIFPIHHLPPVLKDTTISLRGMKGLSSI